MVSFYHFHKLIGKSSAFTGDFGTFFDYFMSDSGNSSLMKFPVKAFVFSFLCSLLEPLDSGLEKQT